MDSQRREMQLDCWCVWYIRPAYSPKLPFDGSELMAAPSRAAAIDADCGEWLLRARSD